MFGQIMLGLLVMSIGGVMIYFSGNIAEFIGRSARAEQHLGGTKQAVVMFGLMLFILGGLVLFGIVRVTNPVDSIPTGFE